MQLEIYEGPAGSPTLQVGPTILGVSPTGDGMINYMYMNADFNCIQVAGASPPFLNEPTLSSGSVVMSSRILSSPIELRLLLSVTGLAAQNYAGTLMTQFVALFPRSGVSKVIETSFYDTTDTAFGTQHQINSVTFTGTNHATPNQFVNPYTTVPFSETLEFDAFFTATTRSVTLYPSAEIDFLPEPASIALLGAGVVGLGMIGRSRSPR